MEYLAETREIAGWVGACLLISALAIRLLTSHYSETRDIAMNLAGSIGLCVSTWGQGAYQAFCVNLVWAIVCLIGAFKLNRRLHSE